MLCADLRPPFNISKNNIAEIKDNTKIKPWKMLKKDFVYYLINIINTTKSLAKSYIFYYDKCVNIRKGEKIWKNIQLY